MSIRYTLATKPKELSQILQLQEENLHQELDPEERAREGFVTVVHDLELLTRMNNRSPHILAKDGEKVVGYALCMHPDFAGEIPLLRSMFEKVEELLPANRSYMVMGQVCVAKDYRKKGVFRSLYEKMRSVTIPEYDCIITEVDSSNIRSLEAHLAIGFKELDVHEAAGRRWHLIVLK